MEKCEGCFLVDSFYECLLKKSIAGWGFKIFYETLHQSAAQSTNESDKSELLSATR